MRTLHEKSVLKSLCERRKQTSIRQFFEKHKHIYVLLTIFCNDLLNVNAEIFQQVKRV